MVVNIVDSFVRKKLYFTYFTSLYSMAQAVALGVPDQAIFDNISLVRIGARFMDDHQECIRWYQQYGLLATQMICPTCNRHCREQALGHAVDGCYLALPCKGL